MLDEVTVPRLMVAGIRGGVGKTTVALGLAGALRRRGRVVQTFKVGPDFVDRGHLAHASARPCRSLDAWMLGEEGVRRSLSQGVVGADCALVEGVMGIFDGHERGSGIRLDAGAPFPRSTAHVARLIAAPVVLVLDVATMGETAAAIALGIRRLDPALRIVGVVLNNVTSPFHRRLVEDAVWEFATLPVLGALPHLDGLAPLERGAGLQPVAQRPALDRAIEELASMVERHCDLPLIERLMAASPPFTVRPHHPAPVDRPPVRIGVAFDDAFCFNYAENLEALEEAGAEIVSFSPLEDRSLPRGVGALYFGGGLAEAYVPRLAGNRPFLESLRRAHLHQTPIYAECGGLHYCARTLRTTDGVGHEMAGLVPVDIVMESGTCRSGYRDLRLISTTILGDAGTRLRGHEWHFSRLVEGVDNLAPAYLMHDCDGEPLGSEGWSSGHLLASFIHLHFGQDPDLANRFVQSAMAHAAGRHLGATV